MLSLPVVFQNYFHIDAPLFQRKFHHALYLVKGEFCGNKAFGIYFSAHHEFHCLLKISRRIRNIAQYI